MAQSTVLYLLDYVDLGGGETSFLAFIEEWLCMVPRVRPVVILPDQGPVGKILGDLGVQTVDPISPPPAAGADSLDQLTGCLSHRPVG